MKLLYSLSLIFIINSGAFAAIGQSAIITLSFPFGARSTGLGETFTGIADNVDATYYNPAGLGQSPLSNTWKAHYPLTNATLTAISSKHKRTFGKKEKVWVGTSKNGILLFNGKVWTSYDIYVIEEGDNLQSIAEDFLNVDDKNMLKNAVKKLKEANKIDTKQIDFISKIISPNLIDSIRNSEKKSTIIDNINESIINLDEFDQNATKIYGIIATKVDSSIADSLADELVKVFKIKNVKFSELVELKIPFNIAVQDCVTTLALDGSDRLWIGTTNGLWRYDSKTWKSYSVLDGLPSNRITSLAVGQGLSIAVGTDMGVGLFINGDWSSLGIEDGLPDSIVTSIVFDENDALYIGTTKGLVKKEDAKLTLFDTSKGLLSSEIYSLFYDSENKLWIGGENGITIYNGLSWKRYKFPDSKVFCFAEQKKGRMWIGTNKGAISYKAGKIKVKRSGKKIEKAPHWRPFHSKNVLEGNYVKDITVHGKDVWLITEKAVNQADRGDIQGTIFFEPLLPAFGIPDLWHANLAGVIPTEEWGTVGFYMNYLNFGENDEYNSLGQKIGSFNSYEFVVSLCYGLQIKEDFSIGLNIKYAHSALAPGRVSEEGGDGVGQTFAVDASFLKRNLFLKNLNLGFSAMNMGPAVTYVKRGNADPIPFTLRLGLSYTVLQTPIHSLMVAVDMDREIVYNEEGKQPAQFWQALFKGLNDEPWRQEVEEIIGHIGVEYWYVYFVALRMGYMIDEAGTRREFSWGLGLKYGNMGADFSYIYSPKGSIARDGQWRFSFTYTR
jgi:hypothetical protein